MSIEKVNIPVGEKGEWKIEKFKVEHLAFSYALEGRPVPLGEYTRLIRGEKTLVMSDTPAEQRDHYGFYYRAKGEVLIAGLGIGMILEAVIKKPEVAKVTVIEISQDLIDLVAPTYKARYGDRLEVICADALEWKPPKGKVYDAAWFDIWDTITEDNLPDMRRLTRRYGKAAAWKGCWVRHLCERQARETREAEAFRRAWQSPNVFGDLSKIKSGELL